MNNRAVTYRGTGGALIRGDFAAAENAFKQAMAGLSAEGMGNFAKRNLAGTHGQLATLYASTGRNPEADEHLGRMQALANELPAVESTDAALLDPDPGSWRANRRLTEMARLNWSAVRVDAEQFLATGEQAAVDLGDGGDNPGGRRAAWSQLMTAAWAMGDYPAAKRALLEFEKGLPGPPENLPLQRRYNQVRGQLERIHVLARAGDLDEARKRLDALWPEVEAVFAVRPEEVFTQVQMARALWVKAEVADGLDAAARRALLERAIGYMRTWAAAGKLTRFDREVVLAGMEKQMETLRGAN